VAATYSRRARAIFRENDNRIFPEACNHAMSNFFMDGAKILREEKSA